VLGEWVEDLKRRPIEEREEIVESLPERAGVTVPPDAFAGVHLSWDDVREMAEQGVEFGAHTRSHAILSRVGPGRAREEVRGSKERIQQELGRPVAAFAYPNGGRADITPAVRRIVADEGFRLAVTLFPGPARAAEVRSDPLMVRRATIHHRDRPARFAAKVLGVDRMLAWAP
jgi:hypothetical protein